LQRTGGMKVSVNWLAEVTGKHSATVKKRTHDIAKDKKGKMDSRVALEAIYYGPSPDGNGFISQAEAVRRLTLAREKEIVLSMEIQRGSRVPLADVAASSNEIFQMFAGALKANRDKVMTEATINEIFEALRNWANDWKRQADQAEPCHPTLWKS